MEPEIARRCTACGAAVRGAARFCPQCGEPMAGREAAAQPTAAPLPPLVEEAERVATSLSGRLSARAREESDDARSGAQAGAAVETTPDAADAFARGPSDNGARDSATQAASPSQAQARQAQTQPIQAHQPQPEVSARPAADPATPPADDSDDRSSSRENTGGGADGGVRARGAAVGAGVGESLRPRVERLRERSVVVLDEAADDPGLRFLLVAAALFLLALLLYVFSFVLR